MEPLKLVIKDFYTLANGEIDFTKFSSALILGYYENNALMSNGAGKSSIFEAICWVVFNKTRQTKIDDIIRWTSNETSVEFEFIFGQNIYKITRRRSRVAKESSVSLFIKNDNKWINESQSTNSETDKKILALLKIDLKIFLNSVYFKQLDISLFANSKPSERKEIIKDIMKLERWDEYQEQAKNKLKTIKDNIEKQIRVIHENKNIDSVAIMNEKSIEIVNKVIHTLSLQQKDLQNKLHSLFEIRKERDINNLIRIQEKTIKKVSELKINGKRLQTRQAELDSSLEANKNKDKVLIYNINNIENTIKKTDELIYSLKKENCSYVELEENILTERVEKSRLDGILNALKNTSSKINLGPCEMCFTDITETNLPHIHKNRKQKREEIEKELNKTITRLNELEIEYKKRKAAKKELDNLYIEYELHKNNFVQFQTQKKINYDQLLVLENENLIITTSIRSIIDQIKTLQIEIDALQQKIAEQKISNIGDEITQIEYLNKEMAHTITTKNIELGTLLKEREFLSQKTSLVKSASEILTKLGKEKSASEQLVRFFGKEGIQAVFIESIVDELEQYANETLSHICNEPTIIRLKTQKRNGDSWKETLEIDVIMNGFPQTFESLGGGEMFRISLALRIGLSEVLVKKAGGEIKLLLLDEVDSPLDAYGFEKMTNNIIKGLEKRFKVLVISHNNKMKDYFNSIITVKKTSNGSTIEQN